MISFALRFTLCFLLALFGMVTGRAGITSYTDPGKTDFDTAIQVINPYGSWSKIGSLWGFTPLNHHAPYTHGQWIYTEYGWYWKGTEPESWVTEHYGYWQRTDGVWSWFPSSFWLPYIVEIRSTSTHIGWHAGPVDNDGNFIEAPAARFAKPEEWTFVTMAQFAGLITPEMAAKPDEVTRLLDDSASSTHTYVTYRTIDRAGPHPADLLKIAPGSQAFVPSTVEDASAPPPTPRSTPGRMMTMVGATNATATNNVPAPELSDDGAPADPRQVKYWITMSLPSFWAKPPSDAKPGEYYIYRPEFFQDRDGMQRRVELWLHPETRSATMMNLNQTLGPDAMVKNANSTNSAVAIPAQPAKARDPFASPFDQSYAPREAPHSSSSKSPGSSQAPVPSPVTNAAPAGR